MIKLQIIGNLGKDCVTNEVNGRHVINFNVAHTEKFKDSKGNLVEKTIWVNCAYWTDRTAIAQYLTKGKTVYAEGTPEVEAYMKENTPAATLRMRVHNIQLLGGAGDSSSKSNFSPAVVTDSVPGTSSPKSSNIPEIVAVEAEADDLPF
ncbi:MAG: single-stranded DNA-binding protein [Ferruginibacter sp.]|nr:single-stranded DNA-binding protein [Bacteroidota bacterium]MCW5917035.1 single-stranded DNA-binding protein [Ferruginibacter sp.]